MATLRAVNLGVRFLLELAALAAFAYWGATSATSSAARVALAIVVPGAIAFLWGMFISPKARFGMGRPGQVGLGLIVFLAAAAALLVRGHSALAAAFAILAIVSSAILYAR